MKIYLENGEVMDLDTCKTCKKQYEIVEELSNIQEINLYPEQKKTGLLKFMYESLEKTVDSPTVIRKLSIKRCDCGDFPDAELEFKPDNK